MARTAFEELLSTHEGLTDPADIHPDDMAFWLFSGGSTGFPKGVVHLHHDIPYTCETFAKEILADHRATTSRSARPSSTTRTAWATT